jgi:Zn-dependent membrane protease YugP
MNIAEICHAIQSSEFFTAVRQSALFYPAVMATHLSCIAIFGGMILATNLRLLGLALTSTPLASVIESTRMWKRIGFVVISRAVSCLQGPGSTSSTPTRTFS